MDCGTAVLLLYRSMQCPPIVLHLIHAKREWWTISIIFKFMFDVICKKNVYVVQSPHVVAQSICTVNP